MGVLFDGGHVHIVALLCFHFFFSFFLFLLLAPVVMDERVWDPYFVYFTIVLFTPECALSFLCLCLLEWRV